MAAKDRRVPARWWGVLGLLFLLLLTPGPNRTPFSGVPLSSQALILFVLTVSLTIFSAFFRPRALVQTKWIIALAAMVLLKALLSLNPVVQGWHATYWTFGITQQWTQVRFQGPSFAINNHRIDQSLDREADAWGLHFINDFSALGERTSLPRDAHRAMRVRWVGHVRTDHESPFNTEVSATGWVTIRIDEGAPFTLRDPERGSFTAPLAPGTHVIVIDYEKPAGVIPRIRITPPALAVTPSPVAPGAIESWEWRSRGALGAGILALLLVAVTFAQAYKPISQLVLDDLWLAPKQMATLLFFVYFAAVGLQISIGRGQSTVTLSAGDDWLAYEAQARRVVFNGMLMTDEKGVGKTYHHYPLYSYVLAAAHFIFGEEFASVMMLNYLCLGALGFTIYFLLKRYVAGNTMVIALIVAGAFVQQQQRPYADSAFSDNLYLIAVMTTLAVALAAFEQRSARLLWVTGVLSGLTAATRPSFLLFPPFFVFAVMLASELGDFRARVRRAVAYSVGFLCGVAPFTLRNWIVEQKFVLIVSSFIMLPYFLYPPSEPVPVELFASESLTKSVGDFINVWRERPLATAWVEARKVLFTLGFVSYGPEVTIPMPRTLFVWPFLFGVAVWLRRVPRALSRVLVVFAVSHIAGMIVGAPWTYGYKTILPLHLAFLVGTVFLIPDWGMEWWRQRGTRPVPGVQLTRPTISVVLPTYNEKDSIRGVITDFFETGLVSEVLVINNNAVPGTSEQVATTGAREIFEPRQGYGAAIRRGLVEARGDFIVVCEPDGTFLARDIRKLLAFADDFDVVYGSRTSQQFVWHGANMGVFLRWGNWAVAKYMEFLYNATSLTDVGCTLRLIRRNVAEALREQFRIDGSQFGPEMMVLTLKEHFRIIQVPVNYLPRVGESAVTGDLAKAFVLGVQMIWLITRHRCDGLGARWWGPAPLTMPESTS